MITLFYIGEARFRDVTKQNHEECFDKFRSNWPIEVLDYTHDTWDRSSCLFDRSGAIQLWDFYQCIDRIKSDIVVKLRTDVYFGPGSIDALVSEVAKIFDNEQDSSFLGSEMRQDFDATYNKIRAQEVPKIQDFVVAAHRRGLRPEQDVMNDLTNGKPFKSGNKTWHFVYKPDSRAWTVRTQMTLVRKEYLQPDWWQIHYDYLIDCRDVDQAITWANLNKSIPQR